MLLMILFIAATAAVALNYDAIAYRTAGYTHSYIPKPNVIVCFTRPMPPQLGLIKRWDWLPGPKHRVPICMPCATNKHRHCWKKFHATHTATQEFVGKFSCKCPH